MRIFEHHTNMWLLNVPFQSHGGRKAFIRFQKVGLEICSFLLTSEVRHWCWRLAENVPVHPSRVWWRFFAGSVFFQHQTSLVFRFDFTLVACGLFSQCWAKTEILKLRLVFCSEPIVVRPLHLLDHNYTYLGGSSKDLTKFSINIMWKWC